MKFKLLIAGLLLIPAATGGMALFAYAFDRPPPLEPNKSNVDFYAHRGLTENAPENTIRAFLDAKQAGFRFLEMDIVTTSDNAFFVFHDLDLQRQLGQDREICKMTAAELRKIRIQGHAIPLLADVFQRLGTSVRYHLDLKSTGCQAGLAKELADLIRRYGLAEDVIVESRSLAFLAALRTQDTGIKTMYWNDEIFEYTDTEWRQLVEMGIYAVDLDYRRLPELLKNLPKDHPKIHVFTVNSFRKMRQILPYVDAIITDRNIYRQ